MRIAIISSLFPPYAIGGAEEAAARLALALHRLGHEVHVISTCNSAVTDLWEGIPVSRIAPTNLYWSFEKASEQPGVVKRAAWHFIDLWNPTVREPLARILDRLRPDVINTHNIDGLSPAVWPLAREYTSALVHTLHDYHLLCPRATMQGRDGSACERLCGFCRVYARYHRLFQKYVSAIAAPGKSIAEAHRQAGWTKPDIRIIPNAVDIDYFPLREPSSDAPLRVLFLSRLVREKGCETLLAALPEFHNADVIQFHIAGRGEYEARFSGVARTMSNLACHGFLTGRAKDEVLSNADVFLQLSECRENAPLALIEAKRHGLYAVGSGIGGIPELIDGPETGRVIPPGDPKALAETLRGLASRKEEIRAGRQERARRSAGYGTREMAGRYVDVFESLLTAPRTPAVHNLAR